MSIAEQVEPADERRRLEIVKTKVSYLPAAHPYDHTYPGETILETVRTDAMNFFGVHDRTERDTYKYFLEFKGHRITDTNQTLDHFTDEHHDKDEVHFNLVEEITPGSEEVEGGRPLSED